MGRVGVDVATELASQIRDRGEDAAGDDFAFDLGEPDLDLVKPGRICRSEVKLHARMPFEKVANQLGFVGREVVEDDVNLLPGRAQGDHFLEEGHEVTAGVAGRSFPQELLRHSTSRMTLDTYTQALGSDKRAAQSKVVGMIRPKERVFSVYRDAEGFSA
jgi:hypothetical protein